LTLRYVRNGIVGVFILLPIIVVVAFGACVWGLITAVEGIIEKLNRDSRRMRHALLSRFCNSWIGTAARLTFYRFGSWNRLYWVVARTVWTDKRNFQLINEETEFLIEATGSSASGAFIGYFRKFNPDVRLATRTHCVYPLRYALARQIPCVFLWRDQESSIASEERRFAAIYSRSVSVARHSRLMCFAHACHGNIPIASYEDITTDPRPLIARVNEIFGTKFKVGDGNLRRLVTEDGKSLAEAEVEVYG
jgi:hypothetical protein